MRDPLVGLDGNLDNRHLGFDAGHILVEDVAVEPHERKKINFAQEDDVGAGDEEGIFGRLVVAAGGTEDAGAAVLAEVEFDGTAGVAFGFDEQKIELVELELAEGVADVDGGKVVVDKR